MTRFKLAENLKVVKIQFGAINDLSSLGEKNDNDDDFTYISDDEDIPTDNDNNNESQTGSAIIRDIAYRYVIAVESISYRKIDTSIDSA